MAHFIPTEVHPDVSDLVDVAGYSHVVTSVPLVETTVIQAKQGTLVPLINWTGGPVKDLVVQFRIGVPGKEISLAGGGPVRRSSNRIGLVLTFDLDVADAIILR